MPSGYDPRVGARSAPGEGGAGYAVRGTTT